MTLTASLIACNSNVAVLYSNLPKPSGLFISIHLKSVILVSRTMDFANPVGARFLTFIGLAGKITAEQ